MKLNESDVLMFRSDFKVEAEDIEGKLFLLTEEKKTDMILEEISKKLKIV
jgi:nitrate reductase NapAB chaperone NapD